MNRLIPYLFVAAALLSSCSKEIEVELPATESRIVVEGTIEPGQPPIIILSRTQNYFEPTSIAALSEIYVNGAQITVSDGTNTVQLAEICASNIPPALLPLVAELTGLDPSILAALDICIYSDSLLTSSTLLGVPGNTYSLNIEIDGETLTSSTTIPNPVALDSVWFRLEDPSDNDSLGFAWAYLTDPDTMGNYYRWTARRSNRYADGTVKDPTFIAPLGSVFNDQFFNGIGFEFFAFRGEAPFSDKEDDKNEESDNFKVGDTVIVKFISMNKNEFEFYRTFESNYASAGDLFTTPTNIKTNINGGLGIWAGLGSAYDTLICQP
jgi:hypothetical protein